MFYVCCWADGQFTYTKLCDLYGSLNIYVIKMQIYGDFAQKSDQQVIDITVC